jgi:predicted trehalose synthase
LPRAEDLQPVQPAVEIPETSLPQGYYYAPPQQPQQQQYPAEDYIDYVVTERTTELNDKLKEFVIKYSELEKRMSEVHTQLAELSTAKVSGEGLILAKIEELKSLLSDAEIRLDGMEKAFKDTLPALIESVRALCDIAQKMKSQG